MWPQQPECWLGNAFSILGFRQKSNFVEGWDDSVGKGLPQKTKDLSVISRIPVGGEM